jgi:thiol-disulfide isomerase/thioredoxin
MKLARPSALSSIVAPASIATLASIAALAFAAAAATPAVAADLPGPEVGRPAPAFHLTTLAGRAISLDSFRGKTLVINVWGSWCPPCRLETPDLIAESAATAHDGVVFLGVDSTEPPAAVRAFVAAKGVPYPQAVVHGDSAFVHAYAIANYPTTIVIDPHGIVRALHADNLLPRAQLHAYIEAARQGRTAPLESEEQRQLDALLAPQQFPFDGGEDAIGISARSASEAIDKAEDMMDESMSDPTRDHDLLRTHAEEARLRAAAIAGLARIAKSKEDAVLLARLRGDQAVAEQNWRAAVAAYANALAIDPNDTASLHGQAYAESELGDDARAATLADEIAKLTPTYSSYIAIARTRARLHQRDAAYVALDAAVAAAKTPAQLAWTHLYGGRSALALDDVARARSEFAAAALAAAQVPVARTRTMYLEEAQEGSIAAGITGHATALSLAQWTGADLPGSISSTLKYRLAVSGRPATRVALHASGLPKGWVASFCSDRLCRPFNAEVELPAVGVKIMEFQIVAGAGPAPASVRISAATGGKTVASVLAPAR